MCHLRFKCAYVLLFDLSVYLSCHYVLQIQHLQRAGLFLWMLCCISLPDYPVSVTTVYLYIITMKCDSNRHKYTWNHFQPASSEIPNGVTLWNRIWRRIFAYLCMCLVRLGACLSWLVACKIDMSFLQQLVHLNCTSSWPSVPLLCSLVLRWVIKGMLPEEQDLLCNFFQEPV